MTAGKIIAGVVIIAGGIGAYLWYKHSKKQQAAAPAAQGISTTQAPAMPSQGLVAGDPGTVVGSAVTAGPNTGTGIVSGSGIAQASNPTQTIMDSLTQEELDMLKNFCPTPLQLTSQSSMTLVRGTQNFIVTKIYENHGKIGSYNDLLVAIHKFKGC